ncbi:MAG: hypothetical protein H0W83_09395 [Planctomycetes bacterium]|nr:hypothetical protein [Planctomycetota bacterium]
MMLVFVALPSALAQASEPGTNEIANQDALSAYHRAFPGDDSTAKRQALQTLADPSVGDDDEVLPLLVAAVDDRQAHADAVLALRRRTGLAPSPFRGQSHYPAYAPTDSPASWRYWLTDRARERTQQAAIDRVHDEAVEAARAAAEAEKTVSQEQ